jgi:hypothetical protein
MISAGRSVSVQNLAQVVMQDFEQKISSPMNEWVERTGLFFTDFLYSNLLPFMEWVWLQQANERGS